MATNNVPPEYLGNTDFVGVPPAPGDGSQQEDPNVSHGTLSDIVGGVGADVVGAIGGAVGLGTGGGGSGSSSIPPGGFNIQPPPPGTTTLGGGKRVDPEIAAAEQAYFQIWGVEAPHGYIPELMKKGMNLFEIIDHELSKPAVRRTQYYVDKYSGYAQTIAQLFGTR
jgi:hypothetical protein